MTTTTNLGVTHIVASQDQKEVTANAGFERLDAAITELLSVDLSSASASPTAAQVQQAVVIYATGVATSGRTVTLPAVQRPLILECDSGNTHSVGFIRGSTTVTVTAGSRSFVYVDGTTNGLKVIAGAGGSGSGSGDLLAANNLNDVASTSSARTNLGAAASGAATSSGLTMATARLLGRTTASTGAVEEISVGSGLTLSAGSLSASGGTITVKEEGSNVNTNFTALNFVGSTVTATDAGGGVATITISGGGTGSSATEKTFSQPTAASFGTTLLGSGSTATFTDGSRALKIRATSTSTDIHSIVAAFQSLPSAGASGWYARGRFQSMLPLSYDWFMFGIALRQSGNGKCLGFDYGRDSGVTGGFMKNTWTNATTFGTRTSIIGMSTTILPNLWNFWLGIRVTNGGTLYLETSSDGDDWFAFFSESATAHLTADQVGVSMDPDLGGGGTPSLAKGVTVGFNLLHWEAAGY